MATEPTTTLRHESDDAVSPTTSTRRRVLAVSLPIAAVLLVIGEAIAPKGLDNPTKSVSAATKELAIAGAHLNQLYAASLLIMFGLAALGVSFSALATLVGRRGATLATIAAAMGWFVVVCGIVSNAAINYALAATAAAHPDPNEAAKIIIHLDSSSIANVLLVLYIPGLILTVAVMAIALWRSRAVPRWTAVAFAIAFYVAVLSTPGPLPGVAQSLPFIAIMIYLATRIWRNSTPAEGASFVSQQTAFG